MRALVCSAFGPPITELRVGTLPDPVPDESQVLIEVKVALVNFPDALIVQGRYHVQPELPFAPRDEAAGLVRALGPGVRNWSVGDAVVASTTHGAFAQLPLLPAFLWCFAKALLYYRSPAFKSEEPALDYCVYQQS